jgi:hypothetical protein
MPPWSLASRSRNHKRSTSSLQRRNARCDMGTPRSRRCARRGGGRRSAPMHCPPAWDVIATAVPAPSRVTRCAVPVVVQTSRRKDGRLPAFGLRGNAGRPQRASNVGPRDNPHCLRRIGKRPTKNQTLRTSETRARHG